MLKRCRKCGEEKPLEKFHKHNFTTDRRHNYCAECRTKLQLIYSKNKPEIAKNWRAKNKDRIRTYNQNFYYGLKKGS